MSTALIRHGYGRNQAVLAKAYGANMRGFGFTRLERQRASINFARGTVARLAAAGVEVREHTTFSTDDERRISIALQTIRVGKLRYAEALADLCSRAGPRLPGAASQQAWRIAA